MNTPKVEPLPGRRPVYPVDADADEQASPPQSTGSAAEDTPAPDAKTEPAHHPDDK